MTGVKWPFEEWEKFFYRLEEQYINWGERSVEEGEVVFAETFGVMKKKLKSCIRVKFSLCMAMYFKNKRNSGRKMNTTARVK